ncbi:MAG: DUF3298 domain-containing protein [Bacteroidales bacterium]|nr:DUF3298 domain-containing protein [Bacteroidales bacterium]
MRGTSRKLMFAKPIMALLVLALAYAGYKVIDQRPKPNLIFSSDSVVFKHGCLGEDSLCFKIYFRFPVAEGRGSKTIQKVIDSDYSSSVINGDPVKKLSELKKQLADYALSYDSSFVEYTSSIPGATRWFIDVNYKMLLYNGRLLAIRYLYADYLGGAHGNYNFHYQNIDLVHGKILAFSDFIEDTSAFKSVAYKKLVSKYRSKSNFMFPDENGFVLPKEFALLRNGLLLHYNVYEISSYAQGDFEFLIPYSSLSGIINDRFLRKNILVDSK